MYELIKKNIIGIIRITTFSIVLIVAYNFIYQAGATTTGGVHNGGSWNAPPNPPSTTPSGVPISTIQMPNANQLKQGKLSVGGIAEASGIYTANAILNNVNASNVSIWWGAIKLDLAKLGGIVDMGNSLPQSAQITRLKINLIDEPSQDSFFIIREFANLSTLDTDRKELCADISGYFELCSEPADINLSADYNRFDVYGYALDQYTQIKGPKFTWTTTYNQSATSQGCNLYGGTLQWLTYNSNASTSGSTQRIEDIAGLDPGVKGFGIMCTFTPYGQTGSFVSKSEVPIYIEQNGLKINSLNIDGGSCSVTIDAEVYGINKYDPGSFTYDWYYHNYGSGASNGITTGEMPFNPVFNVGMLNYDRDIEIVGELTRDSITKTFSKVITIPGSPSC